MKHLPLLLAVILSFAASGAPAATIVTQFYFDDYRDPFNTSAFVPAPLSPGVLQTSRNQTVLTVVDTLSTPDTMGATRTTTLTIHPLYRTGDVTAVVDTNGIGGKPTHIALGADPETAGTLVMDYDFSPLGNVDAGTGNDHFIMFILAADANQVAANLTIRDGLNHSVTRNVITELGINLNVPGDKAVPFTQFPGIDFTQIQSIQLRWEAGVAYDAEIAFLAAGVIVIPEPSPALLFLAGLGCALFVRRRSGQRG